VAARPSSVPVAGILPLVGNEISFSPLVPHCPLHSLSASQSLFLTSSLTTYHFLLSMRSILMVKSGERKTRDIIQVKCIKDEKERLLTKGEEIKNKWRKHFNKLFNEASESSSIELDISSDDLKKHFVHRIQEFKVRDALKRMKGGKAMGIDGITNEVWISL
jgi:hypothetical protein